MDGKTGSSFWVVAMLTATTAALGADAGVPGRQPLYAFCGVGDHLWNHEVEPVDSPATIRAMFEWMADTYTIRRMYWREERLWDRGYKVGQFDLETYDWHANWKRYLINDLKIHDVAVAAAKARGMEIFFYTGLFEHGVQPDVGVYSPYLFEDQVRIDHPDWCPLDRWGERRAPGPLSFCHAEVRQLLVQRYAEHVIENGYDGISFYTYVENLGLRYLEEFGFEQPILAEFRQRYPDVDPRQGGLTQEQKNGWYECRGLFVTQFLRELRAALALKGRKLSMILDAKQPDYVQPWWGHDVPGTGMIRLDWRTWVAEGIVDEIWVQLGDTEDQKRTLDLLLAACRGTPVKLSLRTPSPFAPQWARYVAAGVTPIAVITWQNNGIERYSLAATSADSLMSPDWKQRGQALADIAAGKLKATAAAVAPLAQDPHVLVRRKAMLALAALADPPGVEALEHALLDPESAVHIAAAHALAKLNGPQTAPRIIAALERNARFQFKIACVEALGAMGERSLPDLLAGLHSQNPGVREVCIRALYTLGKKGGLAQVYEPLRGVLLKPQEEWQNRAWAAGRLVGLRLEMADSQRLQFVADLERLLADGTLPGTLQLQAAQGLGYLAPLVGPAPQRQALDRLRGRFATYGDGCTREDAAYGWRVVGNAMLACGQPGRDILEGCRSQNRDRWLAWIAYEVLYAPQQGGRNTFCLVDESEASANHAKYAPAFPGWRRW